jgi:uncharacterized repeat protein (TIGR01451 family)
MKKHLRKTHRRMPKPVLGGLLAFLLVMGSIPLSSIMASGDDIADVSLGTNAYINGSATAQNGTATDYQLVDRGDTIEYKLKVTNDGPGTVLPPIVPNPSFSAKAPVPAKISFVNGSFETPLVDKGKNYGAFWTFDPGQVSGWSSRPDGKIELQVCTNFSGLYLGRFAIWAPDGNQYAELNADQVGTIYQNCNTVPGTKIYYEFYHGARGSLNGGMTNTDTMNFYLRAEGVWSGGLQRTCTDSYVTGSSTYNWGYYSGEYIVPAGQTRTQFAYESVGTTSGSQSYGNYLDGIRLFTNSYIDLVLSNNAPSGQAAIGDTVTYTIAATNTGESDARGVKISQILPAGTEFVPNTVRIGGTLTSNYTYNSATRELTVNAGAGASSTSGGLFKGTGSFSTDCNNSYTITFQVKTNNTAIAENLKYEAQAKAVYQDRHQTDTTTFTNYSNVNEFRPKFTGVSAKVTDVLPVGLTYVSHTDSGSSTFNISGQTCTWNWGILPAGVTEVTVTVMVSPALETDTTFVNHGTIQIGTANEDSNYTYHALEVTVPAGDFDAEKNAYINGSVTAKNGTETNYQIVKEDDTIKYEIKIDNR